MAFTIGEVLNQLKEDFEDITISKIRFLESEGLISPARTESGYRKFNDDDVDRLRFILTAQREHYLPLRVIREQLARLDAGEISEPAAGLGGTGAAQAAAQEPEGEGEEEEPPGHTATLARAIDARVTAGDRPVLSEPAAEVSLSAQELADATGLAVEEVRALHDFGVLGDREAGADTFNGDDLFAARAAQDLLERGLEPRHLRMYRQFADREVALFEQLVTPLLRQRNPGARQQVTDQLEQLATQTGRLKRSLLTRALRGYIQRGG